MKIGTLGLRVATARALVAEMVRTSPREVVAAILLLLLLTVTESAGVLMLAPLLEYVGVVEENPLPRAEGWIESFLGVMHLEVSLGSLLLLYVVVAAVRAGLQRSYSRCSNTVRENLTAAIRIRVYQSMAGAEWKFLVTRPPSELMHVLVSEVTRIGSAASFIIDLAVTLAITVVYLGLAIRLSASMAALVMACVLVLGWVVRGSLDRVRVISTMAADQRTLMHRAIHEHVTGIKLAKSYDATRRHEQILVNLSEETRRISLEFTTGDADLQRTLELGSTILLAVIVYVSAVFLGEPTPLLLVMIFVFARLTPRLIGIYRQLRMLAATLPIYERVRELERECRAAAETHDERAGHVTLSQQIRFEGVSFSYLRRERPAVDGLDLEIRAGDTTAMIGASGSGKSTAADLLIGLLSPTSGRILIDGEPLAHDRLAAWRRQIGYVPQETFLIDDTVRANLLWAQPSAGDADLWDALRRAAADEFVAGMPQGLETVIGERGVLVSGGERQRLSIARALLRRPSLLVLDEATSSLDTVNERRIQDALDSLHHQLTIVIITHRLSTIRHADVIHVMHEGRVVESGTWDTLNGEHHSRFRELARI